jgi:hypothetical protein
MRYGFWGWNESSHANADSFTLGVFLAAGSYTMSVLGLAYTSRGKLDWYIDDVAVVTGQDWYDAGLTANVTKTATVAVATDGMHTLKGIVNGKNAESTDYYYVLTKIWFRPA